MAVSAAVTEVVAYIQDLLLRISMLGSILHDRIVLVVLFRSEIERRRTSDVHCMFREKRTYLIIEHPALASVRIEHHLVLDPGAAADQAEGDHTRRMELQMSARILGVSVFFSEVLAGSVEIITVCGHSILTDDLELAVLDNTLLHAVVGDDIYRKLLHLIVDAGSISRSHHNQLIFGIQLSKQGLVCLRQMAFML